MCVSAKGAGLFAKPGLSYFRRAFESGRAVLEFRRPLSKRPSQALRSSAASMFKVCAPRILLNVRGWGVEASGRSVVFFHSVNQRTSETRARTQKGGGIRRFRIGWESLSAAPCCATLQHVLRSSGRWGPSADNTHNRLVRFRPSGASRKVPLQSRPRDIPPSQFPLAPRSPPPPPPATEFKPSVDQIPPETTSSCAFSL